MASRSRAWPGWSSGLRRCGCRVARHSGEALRLPQAELVGHDPALAEAEDDRAPRVDPGQSVVLTFQVPQDSAEFQPLYDLFWCNVHGKQHADPMRGEILIVETRGETGGG